MADLKDIAARIKKPVEEPVEEKLVEEKGSPDTDIGQAFLKLLPAFAGYALGGVEGGKAVVKGLETQSNLDEKAKAEAKQNEAMAAAAQKDSRKEAREEEKLNLERQKFNLEAKKAGSNTVEDKLAKLPTEKAARLDNARGALSAIVRMRNALGKGDNTFSLVGDNEFTMNSKIFEEFLGRMQSGGAITEGELKTFASLRPQAADSAERQQQKLDRLEQIMGDRIKTLGFKPTEFEDINNAYVEYEALKKKRQRPGFGSVPSANAAAPAKPASDMSLDEIKAEIAQRRGR